MAGKRLIRVDREHQLWGWPGTRVSAYQKKGTIDEPFHGVRECWIICRLPFADDWTLESIDTNLRIFDFVLTEGDERLVVEHAWIDFWIKRSTRARTREELDRECARHGYHPILPRCLSAGHGR